MNVKERIYKVSGLYELYCNLSVWSSSRSATDWYKRKAQHCRKELRHLRKEQYGHNT